LSRSEAFEDAEDTSATKNNNFGKARPFAGMSIYCNSTDLTLPAKRIIDRNQELREDSHDYEYAASLDFVEASGSIKRNLVICTDQSSENASSREKASSATPLLPPIPVVRSKKSSFIPRESDALASDYNHNNTANVSKADIRIHQGNEDQHDPPLVTKNI
jgi:hypothetical protein